MSNSVTISQNLIASIDKELILEVKNLILYDLGHPFTKTENGKQKLQICWMPGVSLNNAIICLYIA